MLFAGELDGGPGKDGLVYFDEASIDAYLESPRLRRRRRTFYRIFYRINRNRPSRGHTNTHHRLTRAQLRSTN
jgi:hypothetical protein